MTKTIQIINIFLFLLVLPICYSITLDELINSYDYSYASKVNVTNVSYWGMNEDADSLYESVVFEIWADTQAGTYNFIADLYKEGDFMATSAGSFVFIDGANIGLIIFDARSLTSGNYSMMVTVQENYLTVYRGEYNFTFDDEDYEKPQLEVGFESYELVDTDADGLNEILRVNLGINSTALDIVDVNGLLRNENVINSKITTVVEPGANTVSLDFSGKELWMQRMNGASLYEVTLTQVEVPYSFDFNESLDFSLDDFDPGASVMTGNFAEATSDEDNDSRIDNLEIGVEVYINESGDYFLELELEDLYDNYVKNIQQGFALNPGKQNITVRINGTYIYRSKINGPYEIKYAKLGDELANLTLQTLVEPYTTQVYNYDDFEQTHMADLMITGFGVDGDNATISVGNLGDAYGFAFDVFVFDGDFNEVGKALIDYLEPGTGKEIGIALNYSDTYYIIVDYDNAVEEGNETNNAFISREFRFGIGDWQLMSFPFQTGQNISEILGNALVYGYDRGWLDNSQQSNMDSDNGYWVEGEPLNVSIRASPVSYPVEYDIITGWNLISYPATEENTAEATLQQVNGTYDRVLSYSDGKWISYNPSRVYNSLQNLTPFSGYWIMANQNATWIFDGRFYRK
jgi:hypothetical protein